MRWILAITGLIWLSLPASSALAADLRVIQTRHYTLHTDLPADGAKQVGLRMDAMYEEYERRLSDIDTNRRDDVRLELYVFTRRQDYLKFTGRDMGNSAGAFMPERGALTAVLEGAGVDGLYRALQHEAFHQFAYRTFGHNLPIWLNEGMAQLFEESIWTGSGFRIAQVPPRRVRQLQDDLTQQRLMKFKPFMEMPLDVWNHRLATDADAASTQYNQAWAVVQFLVTESDDAGKPLYRERLSQMLRDLATGTPADKAFADQFTQDFTAFERRFMDWSKTVKPSVEAVLIERNEVLGDFMVAAKEAGAKIESIEDLRNAVLGRGMRMRYTRNTLSWETESDPGVYFRDPDGNPYSERRLYLQFRRNAPLPDLVCRPSEKMGLRTRFYRENDQIRHDTLVEGR